MKIACLKLQSIYRGYRGRCIAISERRRRELGPDVHEMCRCGMIISGYKVTLVIYRCGMNYRLLAQNFLRNEEYQGQIYKPDILELLDAYNQQYAGPSLTMKQSRIMPWQHDRVVKLISTKLAIIEKITSVTRELGAGKSSSRLAVVLRYTANSLKSE